MTTTRHAGDVHTIFGIQSIITTIEKLAGDHAPDIDIYEAESAYTEYLENLLPYGWTVSGNEVYRHVDAQDIDTDQVRQCVRDGNGFDITAYIASDGTDDIEPEAERLAYGIEHNGHSYPADALVMEDENWQWVATAQMRSGLSDEFDEVTVYQHRETGQLAAAHDRGCSCPMPFDHITVGELRFIDSLQNYDDFTDKHVEDPMSGYVADSIYAARQRVDRILTATRYPEDAGRIHDVTEAERLAYAVEDEWAPVVPDPYSVEYARALTGPGPEPEGEAYGMGCTSTRSGFQCNLPVHDGLHVAIETGDFWTDHGVLIERPVWDDERHIWVSEHTPELPDDGCIER